MFSHQALLERGKPSLASAVGYAPCSKARNDQLRRETCLSCHYQCLLHLGKILDDAVIDCWAYNVAMAQATLNDDAHTVNTPEDADSNFGTHPSLIVVSTNKAI